MLQTYLVNKPHFNYNLSVQLWDTTNYVLHHFTADNPHGKSFMSNSIVIKRAVLFYFHILFCPRALTALKFSFIRLPSMISVPSNHVFTCFFKLLLLQFELFCCLTHQRSLLLMVHFLQLLTRRNWFDVAPLL